MFIPEDQVEIYPTKTQLAEAATAEIEHTIFQALVKSSTCTIVLAGGGTPRDVYSRLGSPGRVNIDWNRVHLFWGDERAVPPDHPDSNFGMVKSALLDRITIPERNVHRIRGEIEPKAAALEYAQEIRGAVGTLPPRFDLILLGIGTDGHTASLFPGTQAITENEASVTAVHVRALAAWRITLTLPVLNAARRVLFMVSGKSKAKIIHRLLSLDAPSERLPASLVQPRDAAPLWMLDLDAAARMPD